MNEMLQIISETSRDIQILPQATTLQKSGKRAVCLSDHMYEVEETHLECKKNAEKFRNCWLAIFMLSIF